MNRRFLRSLHEQHLEEIAILYERRIGMLDDAEVDVDDIIAIEQRLEAHFDALVVGAEPAVELCVERSTGEDVGERFAAIALLCRLNRRELVEAALPSFDQDEARATDDASTEHGPAAGPTPVTALTDALRLELTPGWQPVVERVLGGPAVAAREAFGVAAAARGLPVGVAILAAAKRGDPGTPIGPLLWASGRLRERSAGPLWSERARALDGTDAPIAMLALLRLGDPAMVERVAQLATAHPWACSLLAIAGGPSHATVIRGRVARADVRDEELGAAGLFGDVAVVPRLIECLEQGLHPAAAAQALHLLTGASLREKVVEQVDDPEPLPSGEPDPRDRVEIARLSEDVAQWRAWWAAHRAAFQPGRRYRLGQLASPVVLGHTLHHFSLRRPLRQLAAEEIGLRYRPRVDLDVDMLVRLQLSALAELSALQRDDAVISRADGAWVFARSLLR